MKDYLLQIQHLCSDQLFGQEAIEHAVFTGAIILTGDLQADLVAIMGEPGKPETGRYDEFVIAYRKSSREHGDGLVALYQASGLMDEILSPISPRKYRELAEEMA